MKLLILGGTKFLGRHLVMAALDRNHEVTVFNRGRHAAPADVETIRGDRHTDLAKLQGRRWDAVVDTSGMLPRAVKAAAEVLADSIAHYTFISTQNVYADVSIPGVSESAPLRTLTSEELDEAYSIDTSADGAGNRETQSRGRALVVARKAKGGEQRAGNALTVVIHFSEVGSAQSPR